MATAPKGKKLRRMTDIDRLAQQYKRNVEAMTGEYESDFAAYNAKVAEQMAPYEAELARYKTETQPNYEAQAAAYQKRVDDYRAQLAAIQADPMVARRETVVVGKTWYGKKKYGEITVYDPKPIPTFTEKAPILPAAPVAPTVKEFDTSKFEQRKTALNTEFQREVGERKAARLGAVSRRATRPMLQEA